jgi:signal transduction histidine kinase/ligand-binding sensor domain-containing protein/DNA-binding response OmpR family regulator
MTARATSLFLTLLWGLLALPSTARQAAEPSLQVRPEQSAAPESIQFDILGVEEGLSQSTVLSIEQDQAGFMWLGTQSGLNRYDGKDVEVFRHNAFDSTSLSFRTVTAIHSAPDSSLWVGTLTGLSRYNPLTGDFEHFGRGEDPTHRLVHPFVTRLASGRDGSVWAGTVGGLERLDPETGLIQHHTLGPETADNRVGALHIDGDGTVWVGMGSSLGRLDPGGSGSITPIRLLDADSSVIPTGRIGSIVGDGSRLWIGTDRGLLGVDRGSLHTTLHSFGDSSPSQIVIDPVDPSILWVGTEPGGLYRFDTSTGVSQRYIYQPEEGADRASDRLRSLTVDHAGIVWIGTESYGAIRFDPRAGGFAHILPGGDDFPDNTFVSVIHEDRAGGLWMGTMNPGLLTRLDRKTGSSRYWQHSPANPGSLAPGRITSILEDSDGDFWIGTDVGGISRLGPGLTGDFRHYRRDRSDSGSLASDSLTIIHEDRRGRIWALYYSSGVIDRYEPDRDNFTHYRFNPARRSGSSIYGFHEDAEGMFWVGSNVLYKFDPEVGQVVDRFPHDPNNPRSYLGATSSIYRDAGGDVWMTSLQGGLSRLDPETREFKHFSPDNSEMPSNEAYHLLEDGDGYLWISSNGGISRFDPRTETFVNYTRGLQSLEFTTFAAYESPRTGEMFFGGLNGVNAFYPGDFQANIVAPRVVLTGFKLSNERVEPTPEGVLTQSIETTSHIRLDHRDNDISFEFAALHFKNPSENTYSYQLQPYDNHWLETDAPSATYTNLDPGQYVFRVRAANSDGIWTEAPREVTIRIVPPWWQWRWLQFLGLLGLMALLGIGYRWRVRAIRNRAEELRREVSARTAEVRRQKDQLEEQASELRQMSEVKSRFFANISHEFRTPLTLTFGPLDDALAGRYASLEEARPHFERARRNGGRLLRLINQLLDLSRLDSGIQEPYLTRTDLGSKLREIAALFDSVAGIRNLQFVTHLPEEPFVHAFDADKIEKVVVNLLSNAFKFTPGGGKVDLTLTRTKEGSARIVVADTGPGIAPEYLPRLFDRFYQVESESTRSHEGSGIGLALVKEFVEMHRGTVEVESTTGFGTRFVVEFPDLEPDMEEFRPEPQEAHEDDAPEAPPSERTASAISDAVQQVNAPGAIHHETKESSLVLVVEDNADMRAYIRGHLEGTYTVAEAENGAKGLEVARELVPDLILSDVMMPVMDGIDLCREIKMDQRTSHIPVILLTARADVSDRIEGFESGADAYMPKPFNAVELGVRINSLIEERSRLQRLFASADSVRPEDVPGMNRREFDFLEKARRVVNGHLDDPQFGVDRFAEELSMSRRQLLRKLRALTDESAADMIRRTRLDRAAQLLREGELSIKEIRFAVGFENSSSFTRSFRQIYGVSPSEYAGAGS